MYSIFRAREWQEEAFCLGKDAACFLLDVPGGAGKSLLQAALAADDMKRDNRRKQLICVPQSHISNSFTSKSIQIGNQTLDWHLGSNLCNLTQKRVASLAHFLLKGEGGSAVCTHAGLARLWPRLTSSEKEWAVRNLTLNLDEAHHLAGIMTDDDSEHTPQELADIKEVCPKLSEIVRFMIGHETCKIRLATATNYRGDQAIILSDEVRSRFVEYRLSWENYFPQTGIESINVCFQLYDPDPLLHIVGRVRSEPNRRHLIILPKKGSRFCNACTADCLIDSLLDILPADSVLDLVTPKTQRRNKKLLYGHPEQYHAVVSCCLFNEGTDWEMCDLMHNADACERSATLAMQRFYRPLRRYPGKVQVDIINYLPRFSEQISKVQQEAVLTCRLNAILMRLVLEGEVAPIRPTQTGKRGQHPSLAELYGRKVYQDILKLMVLQYEAIGDKENTAEVFQIVDKVIARYGIPNGVPEFDIRCSLEGQLLRITRPLRPITNLTLGGVEPALLSMTNFQAQFKAQGPHSSCTFFDAEKINSTVFCRMADSVARVTLELTEEGIVEGIRAFVERTGKKPHCKTPWIDELGIAGRALDMRLRHRQSCLADVVAQVVSRPRTTTLAEIEQAILAYFHRTGTWPTSRTGELQEIGLHSGTVQTRLRGMGTSLAKVVADLKNREARGSA